MDPLGTDSCRGTVPMEPLMSNGSMHRREPKSEIDDTRMILHGAYCTIAARCDRARAYDRTTKQDSSSIRAIFQK
jgi:hypothetical protein